MELWHILLIATILFFILKIFTQSFAVVCFSFGSIAAICAAIHTDFVYQMIALGALTLVAFVLVRPFVVIFLAKKIQNRQRLMLMLSSIDM
jgi:membrane protein implicated in regulation of membrane protease activity